MGNRNITCETITIGQACDAIRAYNATGLELDREGLRVFSAGLGKTLGAIRDQVSFIGKEYGGVARFPAALTLVADIARDIYKTRRLYEDAALTAPTRTEGRRHA